MERLDAVNTTFRIGGAGEMEGEWVIGEAVEGFSDGKEEGELVDDSFLGARDDCRDVGR